MLVFFSWFVYFQVFVQYILKVISYWLLVIG
jgi:hypothetical protein